MPHPSLLLASRLAAADVPLSDAELLQSHGIKPTAKRLMVFEALRAVAPGDQLATPDSLYLAIHQAGGSVPVTSIYCVLTMLADADLIERYRLGEGQALYRPRHGTRLSALFICGHCGQVHGVRAPALEARIQELARDQAFTLTEPTVVLRGQCVSCTQAAGLLS